MKINRSILAGLAVAALGMTAVLLSARTARADGPRDNIPSQVRPIPPIAEPPEPADRDSLQADVDALGTEIQALRDRLKDNRALLAYLPDVQIYYNAVLYPLVHHETIDPGMARKALAEGMDRAAALRAGQTPWASVTGPRGYVSRIDGSVQPYILAIPADYTPETSPAKKYRLDVWGHGRDELLTELRFIEMDDYLHDMRYLHQPLEPGNKFILSLYGRYITAYKFAGEIDGLEAMAAVRQMYRIDPNRLLAIGFSLGGTMTWQYATHYPDMWAAASPAAGLAETPEFLKVFQKEDVSSAPWYQQALWHLYNSTDYVTNLSNLPTIAYAGELDPQKQASDMMLKAAADSGVKIDRIIGKGIGHHYTLEAKRELDRRLDDILARGRDPMPASIRFATWTLRYNKCDWLTIDGLYHHWQKGEIAAERTRSGFNIEENGIAAFTISIPAKDSPFVAGQGIDVKIGDARLDGGVISPDRGYVAHFALVSDSWAKCATSNPREGTTLRKRHGLQGPIDDAFMDRFLIVRPTGKPFNERTGKWESAECDHAIEQWFRQFRGNPRVKNDADVTDSDIADGNVILFGDPSSNRLLARIAGKLPIKWTAEAIRLGDRSFPTDHHAAILIYPNPLSPSHYVVVNSGFTYREYDYLNNARQTPKLPDYAVVNVSTPTTTQAPGKIAAAGFFDEDWQLQADDGRGALTIPTSGGSGK